MMRLKAPAVARGSRPGQFIHVQCAGETLLRRPFSLLDADPKLGTIDFIYKVVGLGTGALAQIPAGSKVDLLGPLGRPFEFPDDLKAAYLVGGGVVIPPLVLLAKRLLEKRVSVVAFLGARTKDWVICVPQFRKMGIPVHVATDDGSLGYKGSVVSLLQAVIERKSLTPFALSLSKGGHSPRNDVMLYICGPTPMMAAAAALARRGRIPAQVSLEERMGCAMGCCVGCVVEVGTEPVTSHKRFQRVCTEGPVFPAEAIAWKSA